MNPGGTDAQSWARVAIEQNRRWLETYLLAACGDPDTAEDLAQETLTIAYEKQNEYRGKGPFGGWLRGIARNLVSHHFRHERRAPIPLGADAFGILDRLAARDEAQELDEGYYRARARALRKCLKRVTGRAREMLLARYVHRLDMNAVARTFSISRNAVGAATFRARAFLLDCIRVQLSGRPEAEQ